MPDGFVLNIIDDESNSFLGSEPIPLSGPSITRAAAPLPPPPEITALANVNP